MAKYKQQQQQLCSSNSNNNSIQQLQRLTVIGLLIKLFIIYVITIHKRLKHRFGFTIFDKVFLFPRIPIDSGPQTMRQ